MSTSLLKSLLLAATLSVLVGCASEVQTIAPNLKTVDIPPLRTEQTVELGGTVASKGMFYTYPGIYLKNTVHAGDGFWKQKLTLQPQLLMAKIEDDQWTYYEGDHVVEYIMGSTHPVHGGLRISRLAANKAASSAIDNQAPAPDMANPTFRRYEIFARGQYMVPNTTPIFDPVEVNAGDQSAYMQNFLYSGRSGDTVKFLYKQFSNSMPGASFTQNIQYDLKESHVISFRGLKIEILEATNDKLKYKVITTFPDSMEIQ